MSRRYVRWFKRGKRKLILAESVSVLYLYASKGFKMKNDDDLVKIFTGSEIAVNLLKAELEKEGIPSLVRNDFQSGIAAGFVGGIPSVVELYVNGSDRKRAEVIARDFREI